MTFYVNTKKQNSPEKISHSLKKCILAHPAQWSEIVFLCIGSDRITGDCLGPYVGQKLNCCPKPGVFVYGTLTRPVHALNLLQMTEFVRTNHPRALVVAIDACLGEKKRLGYVAIGNGALFPGAGVHKELPPVGDIHITGIVNVSGFLEQLTLQTTRLSFVIALAEAIAQGIQDLLTVPLFPPEHAEV